MKSKIKYFGIIAIMAIMVFTMVACNKGSGGGGKTFNSAEALKEYLDKQPANSPDKPIKVTMSANELMIVKIAAVLRSSGKYVSLNFAGNALTAIPEFAFFTEEGRREEGCEALVSITIPDSVTRIGEAAFVLCTNLTAITIPKSVTRIGWSAFEECPNLTRVTFQGTITSEEDFAGFDDSGDLIEKYLAGGIGTYTTTAPVEWDSIWTKQ
jgi:hypothetical protein